MKDAVEMTKQAVDEDRAMLNVHSKEIKAVKKDVDIIKHDPKTIKGFEDDMERLKQIMSKPFVPLVPMS